MEKTEILSYNGCVICGDPATNPRSLGLQFHWHSERQEVTAAFTPDATWCGFAPAVHGGILAAVLDDAMAWAVRCFSGTWGVTGTLSVRYARPVNRDAAYTVVARVSEGSKRRAKTEAHILDAEGNRCIEASALFVVPSAKADISRKENEA